LFSEAKINNEAVIREQERLRFVALEELRARDIITQTEYNIQKALIEQESANQLIEIERKKRDSIVEFNNDIVASTRNAFADMSVSTVALGKTVRDLGVKGFGNAAKNIGAALANGKNANQAFVDSVKNTAGEAADAFGDYYIKLGIATLFSPNPAGGAGMIAGGFALKALSGALGAGGGGGGGGGSTAQNSGSNVQQGFVPTNEELASPNVTAQAEERVNLSLNIEGSLVRESEVGGYIANLLETSSSKNSTIIPSLRTGFA